MRIKIHPVRWWRDDETRYQPRAPYKSPPYEGPTFDAIPPPSAELLAMLRDRSNDIMRMARWSEPVGGSDPIADINAEMLRLRDMATKPTALQMHRDRLLGRR